MTAPHCPAGEPDAQTAEMTTLGSSSESDRNIQENEEYLSLNEWSLPVCSHASSLGPVAAQIAEAAGGTCSPVLLKYAVGSPFPGVLLQDLLKSAFVFCLLGAAHTESQGAEGTCLPGGTGIMGELVRSNTARF